MNLLDYLYNQSLPKVYRDRDSIYKQLHRYLSAIFVDGYTPVQQDTELITDLLDPQRCPEDLLQFFYMSFGLTYFNDIDPIYHRRLLENLGGIIQRRGTYSCIHFLARAVTGADISVLYSRDPEDNSRIITVSVICKSRDQLDRLDVEIGVLGRFLKDYVPYYINIVVEGVIDVATLTYARNDVIVPSVSFDYVIHQNPNQP